MGEFSPFHWIVVLVVVLVLMTLVKTLVGGGKPKQAVKSVTTEGAMPTAVANEKFCRECGSSIRANAEICPKCGVRQVAVSAGGSGMATTADGKSKIAAGLLALLLGGLGVHKFYLGRTGLGVLYLLFCWTFIPALIGLIEGIVYLTMSDQVFAEKYALGKL
jgi:TM2 domain-containing membrane protein YozV/ribosomal protein L40E